jgi:ComEC/Rec2-related protein
MKKSKIWLVFISLILLVILRYFSVRPVHKNGDKLRITTTVYSDPIRYDTSQYLKLVGLKVYLPKFPEIFYGDKIVVEGVVEEGKLVDPVLVKVSESDNFFIDLRHNLISFYQSAFPEPYPGLIAGITLGSKGSLSNDFWEKVRKTGVAHVVVASGMNVTFVASFLMGVMTLFFSRRKAIAFVILGIVLYLFISGFEAPLIRAAVMGVIAFSAQEFGRLVSAWRALIMSGLGMLLYNPLWIVDLGFILSFVATASLLVFESGIRKRLEFVPNFLREGLSTSLAAQIGVTPILFVTFGQFNILSPVVNALVLWTVPYVMIIGAIGGILGLLIPVLGKTVLYLSYPFVWWFSSVVTLFSF